MRCCDECKIEPLTPGHYCECCGRKLSLQERRALETQAAHDHDHQAAPESEDRHQHDQPVDRLVGVHFQTPVESAPVASVPSPGFIDPILEAHFAGQAPVSPVQEAVHVQPVAPVAPVVPVAAPRAAAASTDWVQPAVNVAPSGHVELFTDSTPADHPPHHDDDDAPGGRCEVCGGPSDDHDLCPTCRETFQALLEPPAPVAVPHESVAPASEQAVEHTPPQPAVSSESAVQAASVAPAVVSQPTSSVAISDVVATMEAPVTPPAAVAATVVVPATAAAPVPTPAVTPAQAQAQASPAIQIKVRPPVIFSSAQEASLAIVDQAPPRPESAARAAAPKVSASRPAPSKPATPSVPSAQPASSMKKIAAVVAVAVALAAIGFPLGKLWLGHQETSPIVREQPQEEATPAPTPAPAPAPIVERVALPPSVPPAPLVVARAETAVPATAPKLTPAANVAKPLVAPRVANAKPPVKTGRQPVAPPRPVAAAPVSSPVAVTPAPEAAPPPPVAAPEPKPEAPAAPIGPFFELRDVNETPRVVTRVEPQMPDDLRDRQLNEVVIVRVLVTQAGHPMMVNLLRRSKAGVSLDNAIVAAVKQWTFAPAKRRGEAVSCWYHVGVPVTKAN